MSQKATFAAGCFWGVEYRFGKIPGVTSTAVGYEGGATPSPTYKQVCTDRTGHAEVVELEFDPAQVSYDTLLRAFFDMHDPTTLHRQGPDVGSQYRSAIFYHSPQQQDEALQMIETLNREKFGGRIVTQVAPSANFWRAEEYHQQYATKHPGSCGL